jgi:hypothetical protein
MAPKNTAPIAGLTVRRVPISSLHLDPANARSHGPVNLEAIKGSLARFGQAEPLPGRAAKSLAPYERGMRPLTGPCATSSSSI